MVDFNLPLIAAIAISLTYLALLVLVFRGARFDRKLEVTLTGFLLTSLFSMAILSIQYSKYAVYFRLDVLNRLHTYGIIISAAFLAYLTGHIVRSGKRNVLWWVLGALFLTISVIVFENPFALPEEIFRTSTYYIPRVNAGLALAIASWGILTAFSFVLLVQGYRRTNRPLHKNRYRYWSIALGLFAVGTGLYLYQPLASSLLIISSAVFIVYTSSTLHLPDLRLFIRKSASFILSGILAAAVYALLIGWLAAQKHNLSGFNLTVAIIGLGAALALLINPLLNLVQQLIFRVVSGTRRDASGLLNEYSKNISNILDLERLADTVKALLAEAFAIEASTLFLVDYSEDLHSFLLRNASESAPGTGDSSIGMLAGKSPVALAMSRERLPLTQYDIDLAPRYQSTERGERSWLAALGMDVFIPIFVQDRWIGLLTLGPKSSGDRYFKQELDILQSIADQTAVALENAKLYENIVQRNLENERLNLDLSTANEKLAQLDKAKSDFISIASHELRTPLTQIIGYNDMIGDMVQSGSVPHSVGTQMVESVRKAARRLEEIVDTMFDVSRLDTKTLELNRTPTSIQLIVAGAVDKWSKALDERKLSISVKGLNKLPSIHADGKRLTQVFSHLIQNAIKSTPDGGQIRITGRKIEGDDPADSSPRFVEVLVADTGIGISSEDLERIFEKFYRVGNVLLHSTGDTKFKGAGPGLGLTIARGIVEAHGGRIWAESNGCDENTLPGATLHVILPVNGAVPPKTRPPVANMALSGSPTPDFQARVTIADAVSKYLDTIGQARSVHTASTYKNALNAFVRALGDHKVIANVTPIGDLKEDAIAWLASSLKSLAPTTEALYLTATAGFFEFLAAENLAPVNLHRLRLLIRQRSRRPGIRLPQFPRDSIDEILEKIVALKNAPSEDETEHMRNLRDCAFLLTLADTGLRVQEACNLRRGDVDWNEGKAVLIGKGNREAVVRFSSRSLGAIKDYLSARAKLDGNSGRPLTSLPLFARHDRGAGRKTQPITTTTGRNIVSQRVDQFLGKEAHGTITPHSFRHYFVTRILRSSGNLKLAQELARHKSIAVTQRYTHLTDDELDKGYWAAIED